MERNMLQKDPWSHTPHDIFGASYDGQSQTGKDVYTLAFDDTTISSYRFNNSCITSNTEACKDSNSYAFQLNHFPPTNDLNFFNSCENKESSDLLYNDWPDIGNFEDVGRMLRSCNSSFGLGVTGNNDEIDWFTQEDFKFPCSKPSALINISQDHGTPEIDKRSGYVFENENEIKLEDQAVKSKGVVQLRNGRGAHFKKDNRMINLQKKQPKNEIQCFGHDGYQHQERNLELNSSSYMQNKAYLHPSYGHTTNQTTAYPVLTGMKSERNGLTSSSQKESSYVSNQVHSMETCGDPLVVEGFPAEIGLLNVAERSSVVSCGSDGISLEATILLQLQQVMEHLDLKTKLCIKDSLYRLATSAEQRHKHAGVRNSSIADYSDIGHPSVTAGINKCNGYLDIESDTNLIDRSLAQLLFLRPLESSILPDSSPLKPTPKNEWSMWRTLGCPHVRSER